MRLMFPVYLNNLLRRFYSLRPPSFPECPSPPSQLLMAQSCVEAFVPVCSREHTAAGGSWLIQLQNPRENLLLLTSPPPEFLQHSF
ncbi:hypothetical protein XENOCAPTIV_025379 [Xenoophorus captivus]|uniref:Uncharacterized protein n=1 Tax=Xenoophorus captivus TaxID=1517983 RepID=A0ABV0RLV0_9TELE